MTTHTITLDDKQAAFFNWLREELPLSEVDPVWTNPQYNYDYYLFVVALRGLEKIE